MGRKFSCLQAVISADIKDRSGITLGKPIRLAKEGQDYEFSFIDQGELGANKVADLVYDEYFEAVIYPAVQCLRYLMPNKRININITLTGSTPYVWSKTKYYTGEYITYSYCMAPLATWHDRYYVARAIFSHDEPKSVRENVRPYPGIYPWPTSYEQIKEQYKHACAVGILRIKSYEHINDAKWPVKVMMPEFYFDYSALSEYNIESKFSKYIFLSRVLYVTKIKQNVDPHENDVELEDIGDVFSDIFLDDEGYFDISNPTDKGGHCNE